MLKFSGFADLTSGRVQSRLWLEENGSSGSPPAPNDARITNSCGGRPLPPANSMCQATHPPRGRGAWHTSNAAAQGRRPEARSDKARDTEAGMLSGISREHSIRSRFCWFTEFCNSHCLSQFAAPFIGVRAEVSIAESCAWLTDSSTSFTQASTNGVYRDRSIKGWQPPCGGHVNWGSNPTQRLSA
jgi:hypothetical protein